MSGNRTRGLLRAAALLAVGTSPLLASAANAAEAPTDVLNGKLGHAPEVGEQVVKPVTDLLGGQAVQLPAPVPAVVPQVKAPRVAAPTEVGAPEVLELAVGQVGEVLAPQGRALTPEALPLRAPAAENATGGLPLPAVPALPLPAPQLP